MAILTAQQSVNTRDLPELANVTDGTFAALDPTGGATSFALPSSVEFQYVGGDGMFSTEDDPHVLVISTIGGTGDLDVAAQIVYKGTISSISAGKGGADAYTISDFAPFSITELYDDASNGLPTFPSKIFQGDDTLNGSPFDDILFAFAGNDVVLGGDGNDEMNGGDGSDDLTGGRGADTQTGGAGADTFIFLELSDSTKKTSGRDHILDFDRNEGDKVDLSAIDAKKGGGNQEFKFIKKHAFHDKKGELRYKVKDGDAYLQGDTDGNGKADFSIHFDNLSKLKAIDFDL